MTNSIKTGKLALAAIAIAWVVPHAWAQTHYTVISGPTPASLMPLTPSNAYTLSNIDRVDLYSGHASVALPLLEVGGRGESGYTMTLGISNPPWTIETQSFAASATTYNYMSGADYHWWHSLRTKYSPGYVVTKSGAWGWQEPGCGGDPYYSSTYTQLVFLRPDGSEIQLFSTQQKEPFSYYCAGSTLQGPTNDRGTEFKSDDGTLRFTVGGTGCSATESYAISDPEAKTPLSGSSSVHKELCGALYFPSGVCYRVQASRVREIIDRNGNLTTISYCHDGDSGCSECRIDDPDCVPADREMLPKTILDPVGRTTSIVYDGCGDSCDRITYPGPDGTQTLSVWWDYTKFHLRPGISSDPPFPGLFTDYGNTCCGERPYWVQLADGSAYQFYYNTYGEVARVVFPTGGAIDYDYGQGIHALVDGAYSSGQVLDVPGPYIPREDPTPPWFPYVYRRLLTRTEFANGTFAASTSQTTYETSGTATAERTLNHVSNIIVPAGPVTVTRTGAGGETIVTQHYFSAGSVRPNGSSAAFANSDAGTPLSSLATANIGGAAFPDPLEGAEVLTETVDDANPSNTVQTVKRAYVTGTESYGGALVCHEVTTTDGLAAAKVFQYDARSNLSDSFEFDYGAGPDIGVAGSGSSAYLACPTPYTGTKYVRHTHTDYVTAYMSGQTYLPSLPSSVTVSTPSGQASRTQYTYDCAGEQNECSLDTTPIPHQDSSFGSSYTARGNLTKIVRWVGGSSYTPVSSAPRYDLAGNALEIRDGNNNATTYAYADSPAGGLGLKGCSSGPTDSYAFVTQITNALSQKTNVRWDCSLGKPVAITDANGAATSAGYDDPLGRLKRVNRADLSATYIDYASTTRTRQSRDISALNDGLNNSETVTDGFGRVTESRQYVDTSECAGYIAVEREYDGLGRLRRTSNPFCRNPTSSADQAGWTVTAYDSLNRVTSVTTPDGAVTRTGYSTATNGSGVRDRFVTTVTDPASVQRKLKTDALGRLREVVETPSAGTEYTTTYDYDVLDNLTSVTQGSQVRTFAYDAMGRLLCASNPESRVGSTSCATTPLPTSEVDLYTYDSAGNLHTHKNSRGITTTLVYDALNRVTYKSYSDGTMPVTLEYDTNQSVTLAGDPTETVADCTGTSNHLGRLTKTSVQGGAEQLYRYDALGRTIGSRQTVGGTDYRFCYGYKPAGLYRETYPSGRQVITSGFDAAGRPSGVTGYASSVKYDPSGALREITLGNGVVETTRFNKRLQTKSIEAAKSSSLWKLENFYCANAADASETLSCSSNNGNVQSQRQTIGTVSWPTAYTYDGVNRLTGATETPGGGTAGWSHTYSYGDQYGNMTYTDTAELVTVGLPCSSYDSATNRCNMSGFGYDNSGNLTAVPGRSMTYDAENRQVTLTDGGTTQYLYDAEGRRVQKVSGGQTTTYVYDAMGHVAAEYGGTTANAPACTTCYMTEDHLGSTRMVTDEQGAAVRRWDYTPFGWEINGSYGTRPQITGYVMSDRVQPKFTGKTRDYESGLNLDYFGARYFSAAQGRFTTPDEFTGGIVDPFTGQQVGQPGPLPYADITDPQTLNKYAYVRNNPLRYIDPDGHDIQYLKGIEPPTDPRELTVLASIDEQNGPRDVIVSSGYRDPERNAAAGGAKESTHMLGKAADIRVPGQTPEQTAAQAVKAGAGGVSTYDSSKGTPRVHVDVRSTEWNGHNGKTMSVRPEWRTAPDKVLGIRAPTTSAPTTTRNTSQNRPGLWDRLKALVKEYIN